MSRVQPWTNIGEHGMLPKASHDEVARFNTIAHLNAFLSQRVVGKVVDSYERRGKLEFEAEHGRLPLSRHEVADVMVDDPTYQIWSTLRRNTMEMRQQAGGSLVLRQAEELAERARVLNHGSSRLQLTADLTIPDYVAGGDQHLMPGGYAGELMEDDVTPAANYDAGLFATLGGHAGPQNDLAGRTLVGWLERGYPRFQPRRILDMGCGLGHNTLPIRRLYPDAEIMAVDVAAPMLRYGHARAASLGVDDVTFLQADICDTHLDGDSFDLVYSTMVLHETSAESVRQIFAEGLRLLRHGGLMVHLEQPPYRFSSPFEQFMRDWDGRNNNEPFWSQLHELSLTSEIEQVGFDRRDVFEERCAAAGWDDVERAEDYGRAPNWYVAGARKTDIPDAA